MVEVSACKHCSKPGQFEHVVIDGARWWRVTCKTVGCNGDRSNHKRATQREAALLWNSRPAPKPGPDRRRKGVKAGGS